MLLYTKNNPHLLLYRAQFFLEWEKFRNNLVENVNVIIIITMFMKG